MNFYHIHKIGGNDDSLWQVGNDIFTSGINCFNMFSYTKHLWQEKDPIGEYQILLRELSLEIIREKEHPDYPSRKSCIWLIRPDENQLLFWHKELNLQPSQYRIFEVEVDEKTGKLFKGRNGLLPNKFDCFNNMILSAKKYWNYDKNKQLYDDEYLYEGKLKLICEIP